MRFLVLKRIIQIIVVLAIFFFLGKEVVKNWEIIATYEWDLNYIFLTISFATLCIAFFGEASLWGMMAHTLTKNFHWKKGVDIFATVHLASYLPGKVARPLGFMYLLNKEGISKPKSFLIVSLTPGLTIVGAAIISLLFLGFNVNFRGYRYLWILIPVAFVLLHPRVLERVFLFLKRKVKQDYRYQEIVPFIFLKAIMQIIGGMAFFLFINSIYPIGMESLYRVIGTFALAFLAGFIIFLTPEGLGVREGVMVFLLKEQISIPVTTLIVVGFRVLTIVRDIFCVGVTRILPYL
jgi:hypothetical protein